MAITTHAHDVPVQQPLTEHPVVTEPPLGAELLLAQAVVQLGTAKWSRVAQLLDQSECWPKEAGRMTSQGYEAAFEVLMRKKGLDMTGCQQPRARAARKLVHTIYSSLLASLRDSLLSTYAEEARLTGEIAEIREGKHDSSLATAAPPEVSPSTSANAEAGPSTSHKGALAATKGGTDGKGEADADAEDEEAVESETTPKKAFKKRVGGRKSGRTKKGGRAGTADEEEDADEEEEADAVVVDEVVVKEEEEDGEGVGDEEEDGEEEQEGGEEEEETKSKKGGKRKARTAAATAGKRAAKKRKVSEPPAASPPPSAADDGGRRRKRVKTTEEPAEENEKDSKAAVQRRKVAFTRIIEQLQAERYSHFFESRVTKSIAPMYNVAVRRPTCLRDITKAIKSGAISTNTDLMRDVALLCANAIQFNGDEGEDSVGNCAKLLWERFERLMDESLATEFAAGEA
ncbi:bromodomain-containing protein [Rhodotorula toruloides]|uniref:Bromodomain-containing protein n=1 Tax=Rhodotorula toruloides TaxID=5286 RepID=A0A511KK60_RHOTO|nr:bromodomain-containing protein [Rhodotorula toruloides]